ncbi:MAG: HEPN domain-containing protein [Solirubrobacteraceae bacterium]
MPNPDARELASLLQRKAAGDEAILGKLLDDSDVPDDALGFHVQQAVEKRMKSVLALNEVEFEHTHSIGYLAALLEQHGIEGPEHREQLEDLTPWAVDARYSDQLGRTLDRAAVRDLVASVREWSQRLLRNDQQADDPTRA